MRRLSTTAADTLTPWPLVYLVLDEEIYHREYGGKEPKLGREYLAVNLNQANERCSDVFPAAREWGELPLTQ